MFLYLFCLSEASILYWAIHAVTHLGTDKVCHGLGRSRIRSRDYCIEIRCATIEPRLLLIQDCFSCWMAGFNSLTIGPTYSPGTAVHLKTFYEDDILLFFLQYKLLIFFAKRSSSNDSRHPTLPALHINYSYFTEFMVCSFYFMKLLVLYAHEPVLDMGRTLGRW